MLTLVRARQMIADQSTPIGRIRKARNCISSIIAARCFLVASFGCIISLLGILIKQAHAENCVTEKIRDKINLSVEENRFSFPIKHPFDANSLICVKDKTVEVRLCTPNGQKIIMASIEDFQESNLLGGFFVKRDKDDCADISIKGHSSDHTSPAPYWCGPVSASGVAFITYCR